MTFTSTSERNGQGASASCPAVLDAAARLVVRGVNALPVNAKVATGRWKRWTIERQIDLGYPDLDRWLVETFENAAGLAAVTGSVSGVIVVDVDGYDAWRFVRSICGGTIPETVSAATSKGRHLWFVHPGGDRANRARIDGEALDVRADGAYVVVPPSPHPSGATYSWTTSPADFWPPAELPAELCRYIWPPTRVSEPPLILDRPRVVGDRYARAALEREADAVRRAPIGARNDTLNRAAFAVSRFALSGDLDPRDVADALLSAATAAGLPESEGRRTIASGFSGRRIA